VFQKTKLSLKQYSMHLLFLPEGLLSLITSVIVAKKNTMIKVLDLWQTQYRIEISCLYKAFLLNNFEIYT